MKGYLLSAGCVPFRTGSQQGSWQLREVCCHLHPRQQAARLGGVTRPTGNTRWPVTELGLDPDHGSLGRRTADQVGGNTCTTHFFLTVSCAQARGLHFPLQYFSSLLRAFLSPPPRRPPGLHHLRPPTQRISGPFSIPFFLRPILSIPPSAVPSLGQRETGGVPTCHLSLGPSRS